MKNALLIVFTFTFLFVFNSEGQDIITKKNGEDIQAKVIEITISELKYKNFNNLNGPLISILKSDVIFVKYENGTKDIFADDKPLPISGSASNLETNTENIDEDKLALAGKEDAKKYYKSYSGAGAGTLITGIWSGPIVALIPAIATSSTPPREGNLQYPKPSLMKNPSYAHAYQQEAFRIKKRMVWDNYVISLIVNATVLAVWITGSLVK